MNKNGNRNSLTPPLKWLGGKRWLLPHLGPLWRPNKGRKLVEPFCGGLAIALGLMPRRALLNDINSHAVNFYRWLRKGLYINIPMKNDREMYYRHREEFNRLVADGREESARAAAIFYYLNRTGYNGLCRFNRKGEFNVPFGRYKTINYQRDFTKYKRVLSRWKFSSVDFEELDISPGDFVYADPPYDVEFRQYASGGFEWRDQERLARWLANHPGPVVASNQATKRILKLYRNLGFTIRLLDGPRRVSCTGDRSPAREILAVRGVDFDGNA
ncbi:MAG: Dam family site-specific DNA-(adenine-N6)-methyltransferase [Chitinivibrionales bacterium]|nr:Dam family site-specific DNA-(adenine-N6)-methyltransferase [Chitinivibrionales bacterium]MBD3395563.1 Dam family site-specific DNA-(adenine-N6)-methyltransferase [Chitinivibrionales bacterium]